MVSAIHSSQNLFLVFSPFACKPASKLSYFGEQSEPRENARARGRGKESLQRSLINFHFQPGNPGTPLSVKLSPQTCRRLEKCGPPVKASQHQNNVFDHRRYTFFSTGTSNFNVSTRMKTQHFDSSFVYF